MSALVCWMAADPIIYRNSIAIRFRSEGEFLLSVHN
jgi:hypothetical protein